MLEIFRASGDCGSVTSIVSSRRKAEAKAPVPQREGAAVRLRLGSCIYACSDLQTSVIKPVREAETQETGNLLVVAPEDVQDLLEEHLHLLRQGSALAGPRPSGAALAALALVSIRQMSMALAWPFSREAPSINSWSLGRRGCSGAACGDAEGSVSSSSSS